MEKLINHNDSEKQNSSNNIKVYRPISLTSCLAKLGERLMLTKFKEFLNKNNIIIVLLNSFIKTFEVCIDINLFSDHYTIKIEFEDKNVTNNNKEEQLQEKNKYEFDYIRANWIKFKYNKLDKIQIFRESTNW